MKIFIIVVLVLVVSSFIFLVNSGLFNSIDITEKDVGPYTLVYENHTGDYSKSGTVQKRVYETLLNDFKIKTEKGFGIYYDDPKNVPADKLRSELGCILEEKDTGKTTEISRKLKVKKFPKTKSVVADFPLKGTLSFIIGVIRVYPALGKYMKEKNYKGGPALEIYDVPGKKIIYTFPAGE